MKDLGTDDKMSMAKLSKEVLVAIATGIAKQGAGVLPEDMLNTIQGSLGDLAVIGEAVTEEAGKFLKSGGDEAKKLIEKGEGAGKDLVEGIGGLLPGKKD
jgi:hypothetical protein